LGAFGEKLRKQREQRGIALEAISNTTKISTRMLRALEEEQFDQLPGGVFNKGFVRAYARQIGLDEEETVSDYLEALRESQVQAQQILPDFRTPAMKLSPITTADPRAQLRPRTDITSGNLAAKDGNNNNNDGQDLSPSDRRKGDRRRHAREDASANRNDADKRADFSSIPSFVTVGENAAQSAGRASNSSRFARNALAAVLLLTVGLAVWYSRRHRESAPHPAVALDQAASPVSVQPLAASLPPASSASVASLKPDLVSPGVKSTKTSQAGTSSGSASSGSASSTTAGASVTNPASKSAASPAPDDSPVVKPITSAAATSAAAPPGTFTLLIRAEQTTWVLVTADGKPVAQETLIAPAHTSVRATREIVVRAGNAAGISFLLNGKEIPAEGNEGEVKTYVFDAGGVRVVPQTQLPGSNH
jgi:cytoskeletal protein RodZ